MTQQAYQAPLFFPSRDAVSSQEYLLVVKPDSNISTDIRYFKNKIWELVGDYESQFTQSDISIYNFLGFEHKEDAIISALARATKTIKSTFIYLENFKCFKASGTIYLSPVPKDYFSLVLRSLYPSIFNCNGINRQSKIYCSTEPNVTLAHGLKEEQFAQAWNYFSKKAYQSSFVAESLVLLRKELLKNDQYDVVAEFRMK